jgi:hypothetical protein
MCAGGNGDVQSIVDEDARVRALYCRHASTNQCAERLRFEVTFAHLHKVHAGPGRASHEFDEAIVPLASRAVRHQAENRTH